MATMRAASAVTEYELPLETKAGIPPLTQSAHEILACPRSYVEQVIRGRIQPDSLQADRGTEIHRVMGDYIDHCVFRRVPADWAVFDRLSAACSRDAGGILDGIRMNYTVDFEHTVGTEMTLCLDERLRPLPISKHRQNYHAGAAYKGTLDAVIVESDTRAVIDDFKSHPRPFDADTFQGELYAFLLFLHMPGLEEIEFRLRFVRYAHATRSATWRRGDVPEMMANIERARKRQLAVHAGFRSASLADTDRVNIESAYSRPGELTPVAAINPGTAVVTIDGEMPKALPSKQCLYCPLLNNGCPVPEEINPYETPTLEERMRLAVYLDHARKQNNDILKEHCDREGKAVEYRSGNGDLYAFGPRSSAGMEFPAITVMPKLHEWGEATGDWDFIAKLTLSSTKLKPYLKAKKRAVLDKWVRDNAVITTKVVTRLHKPLDDESDANDYIAD